MIERFGKERLLELLLAGCPERILGAMVAVSPEDAADLREARETCADLALSCEPALPSPALRERILAARPRVRSPRRPAVVVLDMIQDYLTPGGPLEVPRARDIVPAIQRRLGDARSKGTPVIYVCDTHPPDDPDFRDWPRHAVEGTPGCEPWPDLAPEPGDYLIRKRTYSAFTGSELGPLLDELGTDEIILTGCATELGLASTATDALQRGFVVTIPPECQAGSSFVGEMLVLVNVSAMAPFEPRYLRQSG
jgi:nicotinamidase-related amidase